MIANIMTILLTSDSFFRPQKCMHATPSPDQTLVYSALFCFSFESLLHAWLARPLNHNTNLCKLMQKKNTQAKNVYFSLVARHINSQQTSTSEACTASRSVIYHGCSVYACTDQCCIHRVPLVRSTVPAMHAAGLLCNFPLVYFLPACSTTVSHYPAAYLPHVTLRAPCLPSQPAACYIFVHMCSVVLACLSPLV